MSEQSLVGADVGGAAVVVVDAAVPAQGWIGLFGSLVGHLHWQSLPTKPSPGQFIAGQLPAQLYMAFASRMSLKLNPGALPMMFWKFVSRVWTVIWPFVEKSRAP